MKSQHNPLIADGPDALGKFFGKITKERARARVVVHKIIAVGDYVWAHENFLNLFNDDPNDTGIAGVDSFLEKRRRELQGGADTNVQKEIEAQPCPESDARAGNGTFISKRRS